MHYLPINKWNKMYLYVKHFNYSLINSHAYIINISGIELMQYSLLQR